MKIEDLSKYDTHLVGFDGQMVVLKGQFSLPVNMEGKEIMVNFSGLGTKENVGNYKTHKWRLSKIVTNRFLWSCLLLDPEENGVYVLPR